MNFDDKKNKFPSQFYYIKSYYNNRFIAFSKHFFQKNKLEYYPCDQFVSEIQWKIISLDQTKFNNENCQLRFGEQVQIFSFKNKQIEDNTAILYIQDCYSNYNSSTFQDMHKNFVNSRPCFLINQEHQYLTITADDKLQFVDEPEDSSYFSLINILQQNQNLSINQIICVKSKFIVIRNYVTGKYLSADILRCNTKFSDLYAIASRTKEQLWSIIDSETKEKGVDIKNETNNKYLVDLSTGYEKFVSFSPGKPSQKWNILTPQNQPITLGIPFLIQNKVENLFLTEKPINLRNENSEIKLESQVEKYSYWVVFYQQL